MAADRKKRFCEECHQTLDIINFYSTKRLDKYPDGKLNKCKKCLTLMIDNWDPDTFKPILEEIDVPFVAEEWNKILNKYNGNPEKITGMAIIGKYLSSMKLNQWKKYSYKDSDYLAAEANRIKTEAMMEQGFSEDEIKAAVQDIGINARPVGAPSPSSFDMPVNPEDMLEFDLTDDDKKYLLLKWGNYKPREWVQLEQLYNDMMNSFDISNAGHIDTLKLICKTSLKTNQLLDIGDIDGAQKSAKMYDSLMKSGRFTAAQNKEQNGEFVDSVGELVALAEKEGFIPRYYIDSPNDKVDETLMDMKNYTYNLVVKETNLASYVDESLAIVKKQEIAELEIDNETEDPNDLSLNLKEEFEEVDEEEDYYAQDPDQDIYEEYQEFLERQANLDNGTE